MFRWIDIDVLNVTDLKSLERDAGGKPVPTFPHRALVHFSSEPAEGWRRGPAASQAVELLSDSIGSDSARAEGRGWRVDAQQLVVTPAQLSSTDPRSIVTWLRSSAFARLNLSCGPAPHFEACRNSGNSSESLARPSVQGGHTNGVFRNQRLMTYS